ncbi:hypothetical protein EG850_02085 [Gulosibacter macacae]|uniref:FAR-17a/AIG1-like protein n=1 Tax=Gulosibacter macacae TaxID=2488791 RepID=A0A3P3VZP2_9MICO|nr:Pr6Pr family membrane protein [Gulosibacter macacae]RRJ88255.1 hypothetical protein EG850_02085 [Gulosibacter macacae]
MHATRLPAINRFPRTNRALHPDRPWIRLLTFALGTLAIAAVVSNVWRSANGLTDNTMAESMSQFTNQGNFAFGIACIISALISRDRLPRWWDDLRGALSFYAVMTGIIYALLVAEPGENARWDLGWENLALHRFTPIAALLGWLLITMTLRGTWVRPLAWVLYPLAFLGYTWMRGAMVNWYPYGFLDPTKPGGWGAVLQTTAMVLVAFLVIALLLHVLGNMRVALAHRKSKH